MDIDRQQDEQKTSVGFALAEMISDAGAFVLPFFPADSTSIDRFFQFTVFIYYRFNVQIPLHSSRTHRQRATESLTRTFCKSSVMNIVKV